MASGTLLTLLDDIAALLDDVAVLTKVATKKTAGVLGDDLALNAEQVAGVRPDRELPVVWAVAKGSALNKVILVPAALLISAIAPWAVTPLLMLGGAFLCYEGCEKLAHKFLHPVENAARHAELVAAVADPAIDLVTHEQTKIRGAVRTDFILSAEIIVLTLGSAAGKPFSVQVGTLIAIAAIMTVGVYGLVGGIVKLDDLGLLLNRDTRDSALAKLKLGTRTAALVTIAALMTIGVYGLVAGIVKLDDLGLRLRARTGVVRSLGAAILLGAPYLMKGLSLAGTIAMFLVGGGIVVHGIPGAEALGERLGAGVPVVGFLVPGLFAGVAGLLVGAVLLAVVTLVRKIVRRRP